jgi:hypothetical protein
MSREISKPENDDKSETSSQEVEFALVLSRMVDTIAQDPEHLRATIYELARHKLKEQFQTESLADMRKLSQSLEVAIQGVEKFHSEKPQAPALPSPANASSPMLAYSPRLEEPASGPSRNIEAKSSKRGFAALKRHPGIKAVRPFAKVCAIALAIVATVLIVETYRRKENPLAYRMPWNAPDKRQVAVKPAVTEPPPERVAPSPTVPTSFGIYAVSGGKLFQLDTLPGRAPDIRVAISPLITTASRTTLPDGHLTFVVYRRDSGATAADRAEVRVVAKIARELGFDKDGKQTASNLDDNWVIRNISTPYRTAPKKDIPDMYEIQSDNPETPLAPGRYALVLKGNAYDFSVAGSVTDPRQCLERFVAANGQFYSECKSGAAAEPGLNPSGQAKTRDRK